MEPIYHREHHMIVCGLLRGFCPFRTKRHWWVEDVVIPDSTYFNQIANESGASIVILIYQLFAQEGLSSILLRHLNTSQKMITLQ